MNRKWSFENGWMHLGESRVVNGWHYVGSAANPIAEIQVPKGWSLRWADPCMPDNPYFDGQEWSKLVRPEVVHLTKAPPLPEHEWDQYILDGDWCLKMFARQAWAAGLRRRVTLIPGVYRFTPRVFPDLVKDYTEDGQKIWADDPAAGNIRFLIDWSTTDWEHLTPGETNEICIEFHADGETLIGFEFLAPFALESNAMFLDNITLELVEADPVPQRGKPRVQYKRTYILLPPNAGKDWAHAAVTGTWDEKRLTIGGSADDACVGDLDEREVVAVNPASWPTSLPDFIEDHYPGVVYIPVTAATPAALIDALRNLNGDPAPTKLTTGWLGMHQLSRLPRDADKWQEMGPPLVKILDRIDLIKWFYLAMPEHLRPHLLIFFRKYRPDEGGLRYWTDLAAAARSWVTAPLTDLRNELEAAGVPTSQVIFLGPNEVWEHDIELNQRTIELDKLIAREVASFNRAHGTQFSYAISAKAVGNPLKPSEQGGEEQWQRILVLAQLIRDLTGNGLGLHNCFNYHAYGLCIANDPGALTEYAPWLQNRWIEGYEWLKAHNAEVPFFHGEGGHVGGSVTEANTYGIALAKISGSGISGTFVPIPEKNVIIRINKRRVLKPLFSQLSAQDMWLNPGQGWNGLISVERAVRELVDHFDESLRLINAAHNNKASHGMTPFQWGEDGQWAKFNNEPLTLPLIAALNAKYHS